MNITIHYDNYFITLTNTGYLTSLHEAHRIEQKNYVFMNIINNITSQVYENNIDIRDVKSPFDNDQCFDIMLKCFNKKDNYNISFILNKNILELVFIVVINNVFNMKFSIKLYEKIAIDNSEIENKINQVDIKHTKLNNDIDSKYETRIKNLEFKQDDENCLLKEQIKKMDIMINNHDILINKYIYLIEKCENDIDIFRGEIEIFKKTIDFIGGAELEIYKEKDGSSNGKTNGGNSVMLPLNSKKIKIDFSKECEFHLNKIEYFYQLEKFEFSGKANKSGKKIVFSDLKNNYVTHIVFDFYDHNYNNFGTFFDNFPKIKNIEFIEGNINTYFGRLIDVILCEKNLNKFSNNLQIVFKKCYFGDKNFNSITKSYSNIEIKIV
jgi:hypothetical protein